MTDKKTFFQCFQQKILQKQQNSHSTVCKVFNGESDIEFGILYGKMADIKTYFSSFSQIRHCNCNSTWWTIFGISILEHLYTRVIFNFLWNHLFFFKSGPPFWSLQIWLYFLNQHPRQRFLIFWQFGPCPKSQRSLTLAVKELNDRKSQNLYVFAKRQRPTLKKVLSNRSKRFTNTIQRFIDKRDFQKLGRNLKKFTCIRTNWQINIGYKKVTLSVFLANNFFFTNLLRTFWNYKYLKSMFSALSECLISPRFLSHQEVFKMLFESHCWLRM